MNKISKNNPLYLFLILFAGIIIFFPQWNYQTYIAQGDHGRDLYSFQQTFEGKIPYKDYWTQNGPLMPYYYAMFYQIFDVSIQSTLIAYRLLLLLCGLLIFFISRNIMGSLFAFITALWYWSFRGEEFFYTYNHNGAILCILATLYFLIRYLKTDHIKYVYGSFFSIFLILLIRPHIGLSTLLALGSTLLLTDYLYRRHDFWKNVKKYFLLTISILSIAGVIYFLLIHNTPKYVVERDMAFWQYAHLDKIKLSFLILKSILWGIMTTTLSGFLIGSALIVSLLGITKLFREKIQSGQIQNWLQIFLTLLFFTFFNLGEFLVSSIWFRAFWVLTVFFILIFFVIDSGLEKVHLKIKQGFGIIFIAVALLNIYRVQTLMLTEKRPENLLSIGKNRVYLPEHQQAWKKTVTEVTHYINTTVPENEKILSLAYCPLYYFLTHHQSATRDLGFYKLSGYREKKNIEEIENNKTNTILITNRAFRPMEKRLGVFGQTFAVELNKYILENFEMVKEIGPFNEPAGWTDNHAVQIYRRK